MMAIWLAVTFAADGIDGMLLDLIIDFLTYMMIPAS